MKQFDGKGLDPLFHSEISSSYLLFDLLESNQDAIPLLLEKWFNLPKDEIRVGLIKKERMFPGKGALDLYIKFSDGSGERNTLVFEIKVHDYLSATEGQIEKYYNAVIADYEDYDAAKEKVFFVYLTQFTERDDFEGSTEPKTIREAKNAKKLMEDNFIHISWSEMYEVIEDYCKNLTEEQQLMLDLNKQWMLNKCERDLNNNEEKIGGRELEDYLPDVDLKIQEELPFGEKSHDKRRRKWRIDLAKINQEQFEKIVNLIKSLQDSDRVKENRNSPTEEHTLQAAKDFLTQLSQNETEWQMLGYFSRLFLLADTSTKLKFFGTGTRGFSIRLEVWDQGEISLCTIYNTGKIDFYVKR